jgi:large subunit ribosomal protein LP0
MSRDYSDRKKAYFVQLTEYLNTYKTVIIVNADNVGSNQMQKVRMLLRGSPRGYILMGKNVRSFLISFFIFTFVGS